MKPDLLITQIKHCDYPIFRETLKKHRDFFGKIIIYFNENNRFPYLDHFMQSALSNLGNIIFLDQVDMEWGVEDWRNRSTNEMLKHSNSEWVCSIEQDWFTRDWEKLLSAVVEAAETNDLIGWENEAAQYIHPSFWFIKRELLERTRKDFSAKEGIDHFGLVTRDVRAMGGKIISTQQLGFKDLSTPEETDCFHLGGVNQNFLEGLKDEFVFHRGDIFYIYNYWAIRTTTVQDVKFLNQSTLIENKLRTLYPDIVPSANAWSDFFKV